MSFEIFLATSPGLEDALYDEVRSKGFKKAKAAKGGVTIIGGWPEVWRANLWVRGASRVLARITTFKAMHLTQLEQRAGQVEWHDFFGPDVSYRIEAVCTKSRIYHSGAAAERIENALHAALGTSPSKDADITIMARIYRDICTLSLDTSGALLHKRGYKSAVNKAPMRENMAALFLQQCGYTGNEPVYDPMCGSGTFVIEAAEVAGCLNPGRARHFAFEKLKSFEPTEWKKMRSVKRDSASEFCYFGSDRDAGAIKMSVENAKRAGVGDMTDFKQQAISDIHPPTPSKGLVILNPPYGGRISNKSELLPLYQSLGNVLRTRFLGWRVGVITTDEVLARATELPFLSAGEFVQHGGMRIRLYRTEAL